MKSKNIEDLELETLKRAIVKIEEKIQNIHAEDKTLKKIISIVESFLRKKKLICYGGLAINNILPYQDQFYDLKKEFPDYDCFSMTAMEDAKELADIFVKEGFEEVEAKAGVHFGTYKVFVNFLGVADLTNLDPAIFKNLKKESIKIDNIYYASPDFLRMAMYLELSRPKGDVSRWEKVFTRLQLLNKHYPLKNKHCSKDKLAKMFYQTKKLDDESKKIFFITRDTLINSNVVFFGGFASRLYLKNSSYYDKNKFKQIPDFDVIAEEPKKIATIIVERLQDSGIKNIRMQKKDAIGELIAPHYEIKQKNDIIAVIFEPIACHNYNIIRYRSKTIKVATIDTMLNFYLAFLYSDLPQEEKEKVLCMSTFLFSLQEKNKLKQKGLFKRFSYNCIGTQKSLENIRQEKTEKYNELKNKRGTKEYDKYFLKYYPAEKKGKTTKAKNNENGKKTQKKGDKSKSQKTQKRGNKSKSQKSQKTQKNRKSLIERIKNII